MSIRQATVQDVSKILEIYAPYVENTAISFEYEVPGLDAFTQRFLGITKDFPWLVWEENGKILGYAYGSRPFAEWIDAFCKRKYNSDFSREMTRSVEVYLEDFRK